MIRVENLSKTFVNGSASRQVLSNISFSLEKGESLAVAGKSGSGKTTLLNCMGGLEHPDTGNIFCMGREVSALSPRALDRFRRSQMGFMFQAGNLISYLTVSENIAFPLHLNRYKKREIDQRTRRLMEQLGLEGLDGARPRELSGGESQRVAFARAIAHLPPLLLADEPTASLDTATGRELIRLMFQTGRENEITIIAATHDDTIIRQADRTLSLMDGSMMDGRLAPQKK